MLKLFSVPIYSKQLNLNVDEMIKYCLFIKRKTKGKELKQLKKVVPTQIPATSNEESDSDNKTSQ